MNTSLKHIFVLIACVLVCMPVWCTAASDPTLRLVEREGTGQSSARLYDVMLDTGSAILNTIEADLQFKATNVTVGDILTGDSIMTLWIQPPVVQGQAISFKAAAAGGISTNRGRLFTLVLVPVANAESSITISARNAKGYLNDGKGTPVPIILSAATLRIPANPLTTSTEQIVHTLLSVDTVPPSALMTSVARSPSLYNNQWFVAFNARDGESGIDRYEIQESTHETPLDGMWHTAVSPFVLSDQSRRSYVHVRVIDKAGNTTLRTILPSPESSFAYTKYIFGCILCVGIFVVLRMLWKRNLKTIRTPPPATRL